MPYSTPSWKSGCQRSISPCIKPPRQQAHHVRRQPDARKWILLWGVLRIQRLIGPHDHRLANTRFHTMRRPSALTSPALSCSSKTLLAARPDAATSTILTGLIHSKTFRPVQSGIQRGKPTKTLPATTVRSARSLKGAIAFTRGITLAVLPARNPHYTAVRERGRGVDSVDQHIHGGRKLPTMGNEVSTGQTGILCAQNSPSSKLPAGVLLLLHRRW